jgi:DNA-binding MarR family transcriptional regulator
VDDEGRATSRLAEQLVVVVNRFTVLLRRDLRGAGVSLPQARALSALYAREPRRITELAESEQVSQPGMTSLVNTLEERGLVVRRPAPDDRRAVQVWLTAAGRSMMAAVRAARSDSVRRHLVEMDAADIGRLVDGVSVLMHLNDAIRRSRRSGANDGGVG